MVCFPHGNFTLTMQSSYSFLLNDVMNPCWLDHVQIVWLQLLYYSSKFCYQVQWSVLQKTEHVGENTLVTRWSLWPSRFQQTSTSPCFFITVFFITNEEVKPVISWVKDLFIQWVKLHSEESGKSSLDLTSDCTLSEVLYLKTFKETFLCLIPTFQEQSLSVLCGNVGMRVPSLHAFFNPGD